MEAMWETLSPVNHILSMRPASSVCSPYLQGFALITSREKYRVEVEEGQTLANAWPRFSRLCKTTEIGACAFISSKSDSAHVALLIMETHLWLQRSLLTKWHHFANLNTWAAHTRSHMFECEAIFAEGYGAERFVSKQSAPPAGWKYFH